MRLLLRRFLQLVVVFVVVTFFTVALISMVPGDPAVVERYLADPLVHNGKASARLVAELFASMQKVLGECDQITLPILLLHGDADKMTAYRGSKAFYQDVGSIDKTLNIYPGLYHEIFNEPEQLQVMGDLLAWLKNRLGATGDSSSTGAT